MSHFACELCGRTQTDSSRGYIAGCSHYPPEHSRFVMVWFGGENEEPTRAFYRGAWYRSEKARAQGKAVHPVAWESIEKTRENRRDEET